MNKKVLKGWVNTLQSSRGAVRLSLAVRVVVLFAVATIAGLGFTQHASAAQTGDTYCAAHYTDVDDKAACNDGTRGGDCTDYKTIFDGAQDKITSTTAACGYGLDASKIPGKIAQSSTSATSSTAPSTDSDTPTNPVAYKNAITLACTQYTSTNQQIACLYGGLGQDAVGKPVTNADCLTKTQLSNSSANQNACITGSNAGQSYLADQNSKSSTTKNPNSILDQLDKSNDLSSMIDTLHSTGSDSKTDLSTADDSKTTSYVNGAGKQQPINVLPCTTGGNSCPAIIWFNGGGWHADDGTAYCLASGSSKKNCTQGGGDGGGDGGGEDKGAPPGGGANARGYTVIEVTYRLGSSGVYYMFEDVMRGVQHVINNASKYGIDPSKIAVGGDSAGGSLSMRTVASGKSGAKVGIGWSAPTNAYTVLFASFKSFLIGMDHSTCIPTDLAGLDNTTDLLNGGSGDKAQYGQGLSSNDFSSLGIGGGGSSSGSSDPLSTITQVLTAAQYASDTSQNVESISKQLEAAQGSSGGTSTTGADGKSTDSTGTTSADTSGTGSSNILSSLGGLGGGSGGLGSLTSSPLASGVFNLASKKLVECIDNFNVLSPALFASPETPPSFLAGFDNDDLVPPQQAYDMVDKLHSLGVKADDKIIPGDGQSSGFLDMPNHLGYDPRFVCWTLNFVDSIMQPDKVANQIDCATGKRPSDNATDGSGGGGGGGGANGCKTSAFIPITRTGPTAVFATAKPGPVRATLAAANITTPVAPHYDPGVDAQQLNPNKGGLGVGNGTADGGKLKTGSGSSTQVGGSQAAKPVVPTANCTSGGGGEGESNATGDGGQTGAPNFCDSYADPKACQAAADQTASQTNACLNDKTCGDCLRANGNDCKICTSSGNTVACPKANQPQPCTNGNFGAGCDPNKVILPVTGADKPVGNKGSAATSGTSYAPNVATDNFCALTSDYNRCVATGNCGQGQVEGSDGKCRTVLNG